MEDFTCRSTNPLPPKKPRKSWAFLVERLGDDLYALIQGGEISLGTRDEIKTYLTQLIGEFHGLGRPTVEGD